MGEVRSLVEPRRLYRYRGAKDLDRELKAIEGAYLYCASFDDMNDPMEGLFASSKRVKNSTGYHAFRQAVRDNKANTGICSFTEVYDHELMWAHYAEHFSGICVAYSLRLLKENLADDVVFVRMFYGEGVPRIYTKDDAAEAAKMILSCKSYRWLYEREWRMFARQGRAIYGNARCVTRVYLGSRMCGEEREQTASRLQRLGIETRKMRIKQYSMAFERD